MSTAINRGVNRIGGTRRGRTRTTAPGGPSQEPCGVSADRIYRYALGPTPTRPGTHSKHANAPAQSLSTQSPAVARDEWLSVTIRGPGAHTSMVHGFDDRDSALAWVWIHAALSDLGKYRYLRQTVATHRWAGLDPDPGDAAIPAAA